MKTVKLKQLTTVNFRGHKNLTVDYAEKTYISGDNATGKSTEFDAFVWLLFGKDQFDRSDYEIIPTINGVWQKKVDPEVRGILEIDGEVITLKRVLHQKWQRPRGQEQEVYKGNETQYWIDDVPKKAGEYKEFISSIIDETVFKLITNPSYFLFSKNMDWKKQREFLFEIAGTITDIEVLDRMATVNNKSQIDNLTNILNSGKKLDDYKRQISSQKKKLKDALDDIQPKIDQTTRLMPESCDFESIEKELLEVDNEISKLEKTMNDRAAAIRGQYDEIQKKQGAINELRSKQRIIVNDAKEQSEKDAFEANGKRNRISNELNELEKQVDGIVKAVGDAEKSVNTLNAKKAQKESDIVDLRKRWMNENEKEYKGIEGCLVCPVYGHKCSDSNALLKHEESAEDAQQSFSQAKETKLESINKEGKELTVELEFIKGRVQDANQYLEEEKAKLESHRKSIDELKKQLVEMPIEHPKGVFPEKIESWVELEKEIKIIEASITEVKPIDNTEVQEKRKEYTSKRDELKKQLEKRETISRHEIEIQRLHDEGRSLSQQIADLEKSEFTIDAFTKVKISEAEKKVNSLFQLVKFKLFDYTNDGNEFEACIPTNRNGVPISVTNTAEKINAGLDIINTLSGYYKVKAPIFCDGAEGNNHYIDAGSQMIYLKVSNEPELVILNDKIL